MSPSVVGSGVPKDVRTPSPRPAMMSPSLDKRDFANVMELRTSRWDNPGPSRWALNVITTVLATGMHQAGRDAGRCCPMAPQMEEGGLGELGCHHTYHGRGPSTALISHHSGGRKSKVTSKQ